MQDARPANARRPAEGPSCRVPRGLPRVHLHVQSCGLRQTQVQEPLRGKCLSACLAQLRKVSFAESERRPVYQHLWGSRAGPRRFSAFHKPSSSRTDTAEAAALRVSTHCTAPLAHPLTCGHPSPAGTSPAPTRARRAGGRGRTRRGPRFCTISGGCVCPARWPRPRRTGPAQTGHLHGAKPALPGTGRGQLRHGRAGDAGRTGTQT